MSMKLIARRADPIPSPHPRWRYAAAALAIAGACLMSTPRAAAQVSTEDRVAAESLFTDARRLMQAGDYEHACPKLEASRRLEPALGTTLNLADCYDKLGRTASA